jgi:hypothetical protein
MRSSVYRKIIGRIPGDMGETIAVVSYCFHEVVQMLFRWLAGRHAKMTARAQVPLKWRTMSDYLEKPGFLLVLPVVAPRWNCHALLATLSPIPVRETLSVNLANLADGSVSWSLVVYDEHFRTREWVGSTTTKDAVVTWTLPPGRYSLSLRYYTNTDDLRVPAVTVDSRISVSSDIVASEAIRYRHHLESLRNRSGLYYRLLHYYIFFYLKHRTKSANWLRRQFLPAGNPDTQWHFGHLAAGEQLGVRFDTTHGYLYNTYIAFYNSASFPVAWCEIRAFEWRSVALAEDVSYAIRRVRKVGGRVTQGSDGVFEAQIHSSRLETHAMGISYGGDHEHAREGLADRRNSDQGERVSQADQS